MLTEYRKCNIECNRLTDCTKEIAIKVGERVAGEGYIGDYLVLDWVTGPKIIGCVVDTLLCPALGLVLEKC